MHSSLLELICCPVCGQGFEVDDGLLSQQKVWDGNLRCEDCGRNYAIVRGMPHLYVDDERWVSKAREAQGWVDFHKEKNIYEQSEDAVDLKIPYYPEEPWITVAGKFDIALKELEPHLTPDTCVLDFGAGRGWAAKHFALRGCRAVAIDVAPDENVGLGRSWALMKHANVYFDPVIGDGESLPFFPESFNLVFCAATLHHTSDLALFVKNIHEVLKPGGRFCAICEPCIAINENAQHVLHRDAGDELKHGINEQRPNLLEYWDALSGAGFADVNFIWPPGYSLAEAKLEDHAKGVGAIFPGLSRFGPQVDLKRWLTYARFWLSAVSKWSAVGRLPHLEDRRKHLMRSILLRSTGGVVIFARKAIVEG